MLKEFLNLFQMRAGLSEASLRALDIKTLSLLFARTIPRNGVSVIEHARLLENWMVDEYKGPNEMLRVAKGLDAALTHGVDRTRLNDLCRRLDIDLSKDPKPFGPGEREMRLQVEKVLLQLYRGEHPAPANTP